MSHLVLHSDITSANVELEEPEGDQFAVDGRKIARFDSCNFNLPTNPAFCCWIFFPSLLLQIVIDLENGLPFGIAAELNDVEFVHCAEGIDGRAHRA